MADTNFGRLERWRESLAVRGYEWVFYAWSAGIGALWGWLVNPFVVGYDPSNPWRWLSVWPAWLDLQVRLLLSTTAYWNPILEASIIGAIGGCVAVYVLLTASHVRDSS